MRIHDVVVYGATGFTGRLVAERLAQRAPEGTRIALAGRSTAKLEEVRAGLPERAHDWPLVLADSTDPESMTALAKSTVAVATTVGPYLSYGMPLVKACAEEGTHYVDLAGEVLFMRKTIDTYYDVAAASGARIVHACGFDSIPSDLGVLTLASAAGALGNTTFVVRAMKGGFSGGTIASMRGQLEAMEGDPSLKRVAGDPYALSPSREAEPNHGKERDLMSVTHDDKLGWFAPFVMASINTRVVRRSNALAEYRYGRDFVYREVQGFGEGVKAQATATAMTAGLGALMAGMSFGPTKPILKKALPDPGEGPDAKAREEGFFKISIHSTDSAGADWVANVAAQGDPGYGATSVMLAEAVLCAALDDEKLKADEQTIDAGVLTPATAFGATLIDRLRAAGMTFEASKA